MKITLYYYKKNTTFDIFLKSPSISMALKGGDILAISYNTQPKLQISHLESYALSLHISGAA